MKKQLITLAVCLALTTTSALASNSQVTKVTNKKPSACLAKVAKKAEVKKDCCKENFEAKMAKEKENFFCKLGLSQEQRKKADALEQKSKDESEFLLAKLYTEKAKFHELKGEKACPERIKEQATKIKEARKALKDHMEKSKKDFEALLNKDQKAKLEVLKEERKKDFEKFKCSKHHHNHDMFGPGPCGPEAFGPGPDESAPPPKCPCASK